MDPYIYNYDKLINYKKENHNNKYLEYLYTTNNVVESINGKLNYYLTKGMTSNTNFVNSITKYLINDTYEANKKKSINRHNYIIKKFLKILDSDYFKDGLKWINYDDFVDFEKQVIKECYPINNSINIDELIKYIDIIFDNENDNLDSKLHNHINSINIPDLKEVEDSFSLDNENFNNKDGEMDLSDNSFSNKIINDNNDITNLIDKLNLNCDKIYEDENTMNSNDNLNNKTILDRLKDKYPSKSKLTEKYRHNNCKPIKTKKKVIYPKPNKIKKKIGLKNKIIHFYYINSFFYFNLRKIN